ncbi:MAG: V-type ATP synthase subunit E [Nitrososphaerales archaeon]
MLREVEAKRKNALQALDAEYSSKVAEVKSRAEKERGSITESARKQSSELSQREKIRIEGASKLQSKKMIFDATEKMLENNIASLKQSLAAYTGTKEYTELLPKMAMYSAKRLGGEIAVKCREKDAPLLKKAGYEILASNLNTMGGLKAERKDGTLELDLTFEEILRSRDEEVRGLILSKGE